MSDKYSEEQAKSMCNNLLYILLDLNVEFDAELFNIEDLYSQLTESGAGIIQLTSNTQLMFNMKFLVDEKNSGFYLAELIEDEDYTDYENSRKISSKLEKLL